MTLVSWDTFWEWFDVGLQLVPFSDLGSDIYLLIVVWPSTEMIAPSSIETCEGRALWYMALAFTVVGTLVDLMPESLLLTEMVQHCDVFKTRDSAWQMFKLFCSDGKPVIAFAAADSIIDRPSRNQWASMEPLEKIRASLRRRLAAIAAGLRIRDDLCCSGDDPEKSKWTYAGLLGILLGGELLTAVGALLFLLIEFSWAALVSLVASIISLLLSTRSTMCAVGHKGLHLPEEPTSLTGRQEAGGRLVDFLIPGPITVVRFLLVVPVWPMAVVYAEAVPFTPFSLLHDHSWPSSDDARWVNPIDWLRITAPTSSSDSAVMGMSFMAWAIAPHLVWTLAVAAWTALAGSLYGVRWYCGYESPTGAVDWSKHFADQYSMSHWLARRLQGVLGLGFTMTVAREARILSFFMVLQAVVLYLVIAGGDTCVEQEWVFVFAVTAWWGVMLVGHTARFKNFFANIVAASHSPISRSFYVA